MTDDYEVSSSAFLLPLYLTVYFLHILHYMIRVTWSIHFEELGSIQFLFFIFAG